MNFSTYYGYSIFPPKIIQKANQEMKIIKIYHKSILYFVYYHHYYRFIEKLAVSKL